jgi:hypothetical protein
MAYAAEEVVREGDDDGIGPSEVLRQPEGVTSAPHRLLTDHGELHARGRDERQLPLGTLGPKDRL